MKSVAARTMKQESSKNGILLWLFYCCMIAVAAVVLSTPVFSQGKKKDEDPELKPRPVTLKTKDGVALRAFFFPSPKGNTPKGKDAVTVLLVHEWQGQASPYGPLVVALRDAGCAVLVPDYRGHGGSKEYTDRSGKKKKFNLATMNKRDLEAIVYQDLEESKRFLKKENNEERLNLNAMVVIGVREGCVFASMWAQRDWSFATVGSRKRGQDVKALVLISPKKNIKGLSLDKALAGPALQSLPIMLVAGKGSPEESETKRLYKRIEVFKKKMARDKNFEGLDLMLSKMPASGPRLITTKSSDVTPAIVKFVKANVTVSDEENPWIERE